MPSYIGHTACAYELLKRLNISDEDKTKFIIGNMLPDIKQVDIDYTLDEFINKRRIQRSKRLTHFRKNTNFILEYPHCRIFLEKYEKEVKEHIETMAYFFHLYTDYAYFKYFLPYIITFLDDNYNEVDEKDNFYYVMINKSHEIIKARSFFSKLSDRSLYKEYTRSNSYLIRRYNINLNTKYMKDYLKRNGYNTYVEEIDLSKAYDIFNRIDKVYDRINDDELEIFTEDMLDAFVSKVTDSFIEEYSDLLKKYM